MRVVNECRVNFQYKLSPQSPVIMKTICSNIVYTDIVKYMLKIEKYTDKKYSYAFDMLTYTICITNISKIIATNVFFQDKIPNGTRFIENTVTINNTLKRGVNPEEGFRLWDISPGQIIKITFKVVVLPQCFCNIIKNYSTIEHDYIYNIEKPPTRIAIESNKVKTLLENRVFKASLVDNSLKLCDKINKMIDVKVKVKILQTKIANTPVSDMNKNDFLNLCTLVVLGSIEYEINYIPQSRNRRKINKDSIKSVTDILGFSEYMVVPIGITYLDKNNIKVDIKNIFTDLVNKNTVFISTNILLYY